VKARIETEEKMEKPTNIWDGILFADGLHCVTSKVPMAASLSLFLISIQSSLLSSFVIVSDLFPVVFNSESINLIGS